MRPIGHLALSAAVAGGSYIATGSPQIAIPTFLIGFLLDGDHLFDYAYYLYKKRHESQPANVGQFLNSSYMNETGKTFVLLHSYELLIPIWLICLFLYSIPLAIWLTVSSLGHLIADQLYHRPHPLSYSLAFRITKGFSKSTICLEAKGSIAEDKGLKSYDAEYSSRPYELRPPTDVIKDKTIYRLIQNTTFNSKRLLDLGCGTGHTCTLLSKLVDVIGLDSSKEAIETATEKSKGVFIRGDAQALPFQTDSFDYVVAKDILEHTPNDGQVLDEIFRVSKDKAKIIMYLPCELDGINLSTESIVKRLTGYTIDPEVGHLRRYTVERAKQMLQIRQLKPVKTWYMVHFSLGVVALLTVRGFHVLTKKGKSPWLLSKGSQIIVKFFFKIFESLGRIEAAILRSFTGAGFFITAEVEKRALQRPKLENPLVSVIVPTQNSAKTLESCLASIKNQTHPHIELIVVDNYSTDETKAIASKYTDSFFEKGPERNTQRIYAVNKAKGGYLAFIDSDMELPPNLIESALNKCEEEGFDAVILPEISVGEGFWADCRKLEKLCYLSDQSMELANRFMRADIYYAVGGYDYNKDWIGGEDFDIHERVKDGGYRIGRITDAIKHHEVVPFGKMLHKYYIYGKHLPRHVRKHPKTGVRQFFIIRPAYLRNWRLFIKDPVHGIALMIMKLSQYLVGGLGFLSSLLANIRSKQNQKSTDSEMTN